jgi:hypothetical protein
MQSCAVVWWIIRVSPPIRLAPSELREQIHNESTRPSVASNDHAWGGSFQGSHYKGTRNPYSVMLSVGLRGVSWRVGGYASANAAASCTYLKSLQYNNELPTAFPSASPSPPTRLVPYLRKKGKQSKYIIIARSLS